MRSLVLAGSLLAASLVASAQDGIMRSLLLRGPNTTAANVATLTVPVLAGPLTFTLPPNGGELLVSAPTTNGQMNNLELQGALTLNGLTGPGVLTLNAAEQVVNLAGSNGQLLQWVGGVPTFQDVATVFGGTPWVLTGNAITNASTQFVGTTSDHPLVLRSNNIERLRLNTNGSIQRNAGGDARGDNAVDLQVTRTFDNQVASGFASVIGGGHRNRASGQYATVLGGDLNQATNSASTIGGGSANSATADRATVGGGSGNQATGGYSTIGGGRELIARSYGEAVAGVYNTDYMPSSATTFNAADRLFVLGNGTTDAARADALVVFKSGAVAFGAAGNTGAAGHILVSQGSSASPQWQGAATALGGTTWLLAGNAIADPLTQFVGTTSNLPLVLRSNNLERLRLNTNNSIQRNAGGDARGTDAVDLQVFRTNSDQVASGFASVISGGRSHLASGQYSVVSGGNMDSATAASAFVGGGTGNKASGQGAAIVGGYNSKATEYAAAIGGGVNNHATAVISTISGGEDNVASGVASAIPGGRGLLARSWGELVGGSFNTNYIPANASAFNAADRLFVLGNGTADAARADALVVFKNGAVAFGAAGNTGAAGHILVSQGSSASPQWQLVATALGGTAVLYGSTSPQNTRTAEGTLRLFDVSYSNTPTGAALGARIQSGTDNFNATGLTIAATVTGTGANSTGISVSASGGATTNRAIDVTAGDVVTGSSSTTTLGGRLNVNNIEVHTPVTVVGDVTGANVVLGAFTSRYIKLDVTNTSGLARTITLPAGASDGQRLTVKARALDISAGSTVTLLNTRVDETGADGVLVDAQNGQHFLSEFIYDADTNEWVLLSSTRVL